MTLHTYKLIRKRQLMVLFMNYSLKVHTRSDFQCIFYEKILMFVAEWKLMRHEEDAPTDTSPTN